MNVYDYVRGLKLNGKVKRKEYEWLSNIYVYTNNERVYKVALQFDYGTLKKAKKSGVIQPWRVFNDDVMLNLDGVAKVGRMICKYDCFNKNILYFTGEDY